MEYEDRGTRLTSTCPDCKEEGTVVRADPPKIIRCEDCQLKWLLLIDSPIQPDGEF